MERVSVARMAKPPAAPGVGGSGRCAADQSLEVDLDPLALGQFFNNIGDDRLLERQVFHHRADHHHIDRLAVARLSGQRQGINPQGLGSGPGSALRPRRDILPDPRQRYWD